MPHVQIVSEIQTREYVAKDGTKKPATEIGVQVVCASRVPVSRSFQVRLVASERIVRVELLRVGRDPDLEPVASLSVESPAGHRRCGRGE
jgi:hypothetical protein